MAAHCYNSVWPDEQVADLAGKCSDQHPGDWFGVVSARLDLSNFWCSSITDVSMLFSWCRASSTSEATFAIVSDESCRCPRWGMFAAIDKDGRDTAGRYPLKREYGTSTSLTESR